MTKRTRPLLPSEVRRASEARNPLPKAQTPTVILNVRIAPELMERLRAWAARLAISQAAAVAVLLREGLDAQGVWKEGDTE